MEDGRLDEQHCGPPDTVLPWLEQQHIPQTKQQDGEGDRDVECVGGMSGDSEGEGWREGSECGIKANRASSQLVEKDTESTVDPLCTVEQQSSPDSGNGDDVSREHALVQEEEREVGVVALKVYIAYWAAVGSILAPAIFIALLLMQGTHTEAI